eukprot:RCo014221
MLSLLTPPLLSDSDSSDSSVGGCGIAAVAAAAAVNACPSVLLLQGVLGLLQAEDVPEASLRRLDVMLNHLAAAVNSRLPSYAGNGEGHTVASKASAGAFPTDAPQKKAKDTYFSQKNYDHKPGNGVLFPRLDALPKTLLPHLPHPGGPCHGGNGCAPLPPTPPAPAG